MSSKSNIMNSMNYNELIEASVIIDDFVHGYEVPNEFESENVKVFADNIRSQKSTEDICKIREKLSSKIVAENKKSIRDINEAKRQYRQFMAT